jgi:hypothetical protein
MARRDTLELGKKGRGLRAPVRYPSGAKKGKSGGAGPGKGTIHPQRAFRAPPAFVKITGYKTGGLGQLKEHINYVTKNGKLTFTTSDGDELVGRDVSTVAIGRWKGNLGKENDQAPAKDGAKNRRAVALIVSTPKGVTPEQFRPMVDDFCAEAIAPAARFGYAIHDNTENVHAHIVVPIVGHDGRKLRIDREEIDRLRLVWTAVAERHGLVLDPSNRFARGENQSGLTHLDRTTFYAHQNPSERARRRGGQSNATGKPAHLSAREKREIGAAVRDQISGKLAAREAQHAAKWGELAAAYKVRAEQGQRDGIDAGEIGFYSVMASRPAPKLRASTYVEVVRTSAAKDGAKSQVVQAAMRALRLDPANPAHVPELMAKLDVGRGRERG